MVIINNRYEYLSILKAPGVRMQTPVVSNNNSSTTLTRDTLVQSQQQPQNPPLNNNNNNNSNPLLNNNTINLNNNNGNGVSINNNNNGLPGLAKAVLICRQNSHPFNNRTLFLEPHQEVKVGRSVARNRVSENNAIFDCKVLSRNHAVLWYSDGKFFIKDTCSSNGTFINNVRLSQTSIESEPFEVSSGDIVQFGVDVMENTRRETHGCIVATLKLFLPDGRETKASQSTGVGGPSTKIPPVDLYRLNQYIQEANQREQILETKLTSLQKMVEATKHNSAMGWQAMIDEDRLLSRIDMLEKKLQYFQKGMTDDKLREEILKLQDEKYQYQNTAKDALRKVHQDALDATHKVNTIEKALCSSEDECSLLREQLNKTQLQLQEVTGRLDALQNQYDERLASSEEQLKVKESEITSLGREINLLQEKLSFYAFYASDEEDNQQQQPDYNNSAISDWLLKSDIKKMEGSEDIIKAICNDAETDANVDEKENNLEDNLMQLQKRILTLERHLSLMVDEGNKPEENNEPNDNASMTSASTLSTMVDNDNSVVSAVSDSDGETSNGEECDGNQNVSSIDATIGDAQQSIPSESETTTTTTATSIIDQQHQKQSSEEFNSSSRMNCELNKKVLRRNLKHVKSVCALLVRQINKAKEDNRKSEKNMVAQAKYDELETELSMLKQELDTRPKSEDLEKKQQQCESLSENLTSLRIETEELRSLNERCQEEMDRMEKELLKQKNIENEMLSARAATQKLGESLVLQETFYSEGDNASIKDDSSKSAQESTRKDIVDAETQTYDVDENAVMTDDVIDNDISIGSNLGDFDEDEEDDDEKTETIDTTEIFVDRNVPVSESVIVCGSSSLLMTSNSHNSSNPSSNNLSATDSESSKFVDSIGDQNGFVTERVDSTSLLDNSGIEQELDIINHPDVQREEELIAFKEKYTHLTQENIRLNQQLQKLSDDFSHFKSKSFINILMYIAPVIVIVGYIMFNRLS